LRAVTKLLGIQVLHLTFSVPVIAGDVVDDVFVSYNGADRPTVERLCNALVKRGISPFFDTWDLIPGRDWQGGLLSALDRYNSAAICLGPNGPVRWQRQEQQIALDRHAREGDRFPVIPILLPDFDLSSTPLGFLKLHTWVDLGQETPANFDALAAAIRGEKLGQSERPRADAVTASALFLRARGFY